MKKYLVIVIAIFMLSSVNVYAQTMSKYGYPEGYKPNKTVNTLQNTTQNNSVSSVSNNSNSGLFPHHINPAILSVNNMLSVSYSDLGLNYGEYNDGAVSSINNKYLDTDNGFINGFAISLSNTYKHWYSKENFSYYSGNVTYTGYNQEYGGTVLNPTMIYLPINFTESSKIYNFNWKIGYMLPITDKFVITPYGELGWHIWKRGDNTSKYAHYSNWLAMVGLLAQYAFTPKLVGDIDFGYGTTFDAQAKEDNNASGGSYYCQNNEISTCNSVGVNSDTITFDLGSKAIYNLSAGLDYRFYRKFHIFADVNYERFKYGQSSTVNLAPTAVYNNGALEYFLPESVTEPNSVTNEIIYSIGLGYSF